jgi:hypothetical protein
VNRPVVPRRAPLLPSCPILVLSALVARANTHKTGKGTKEAHWCFPQMGIPEQINLQYAAPDTVVAAFVTYEKVGLYPIVTFQYSLTTLYQFSYHIR